MRKNSILYSECVTRRMAELRREGYSLTAIASLFCCSVYDIHKSSRYWNIELSSGQKPSTGWRFWPCTFPRSPICAMSYAKREELERKARKKAPK